MHRIRFLMKWTDLTIYLCPLLWVLKQWVSCCFIIISQFISLFLVLILFIWWCWIWWRCIGSWSINSCASTSWPILFMVDELSRLSCRCWLTLISCSMLLWNTAVIELSWWLDSQVLLSPSTVRIQWRHHFFDLGSGSRTLERSVAWFEWRLYFSLVHIICV